MLIDINNIIYYKWLLDLLQLISASVSLLWEFSVDTWRSGIHAAMVLLSPVQARYHQQKQVLRISSLIAFSVRISCTNSR